MMEDLTLYLAGLFLRLGVPLGMTALLVWVFKRLDIHWLEQTQTQETEPKAGRIPWPRKRRDDPRHCVFYEQGFDPCWEMRLAIEGELPKTCLRCPVYLASLHKQAA